MKIDSYFKAMLDQKVLIISVSLKDQQKTLQQNHVILNQ